MIQPGNKKLGAVPCFSITACETCPGASEACKAACYATKNLFKMASVQRSHLRNWEASQQGDFVREMIAEIERRKLKRLRVHVAGDFYTAAYVRKWVKIAEACPDVVFYAYTRSWRRQRILPALITLSLLDNFQLWWSCDKETHEVDGRPPEVHGVKSCYMQCDDDDNVPAYSDLVFRVCRDTVLHTVNRIVVCPAESGTKPKRHCEECQLCWSATATQQAARHKRTVARV